jgi:hypothetical protein
MIGFDMSLWDIFLWISFPPLPRLACPMSSGKRQKSGQGVEKPGRDTEKPTKPGNKAVSDLLHAIKAKIEELVPVSSLSVV